MSIAAEEQIRASRRTLHAAPRRELTVSIATLVCGALLFWGWSVREEFYWSAERGLGYALGIVGLVCLVSLLSYSLRKRRASLRGLGQLAPWFRVHMVLGIVGPTAILFHANFAFGSVNSSIALLSMLAVAASGYMGRFIYARIHRGLFGERQAMAELIRDAEEGWGAVERLVELEPELGNDLQAFEQWALDRTPGLRGSMLRFVAVGSRGRRLKRRATSAIKKTGRDEFWFLEQVLDEQLAAAKRVAQFGAYERFFALWHAIHLPLAFILFGAAAVHVVAVHLF